MENNIELLSPVGDFECLKAAVQNGADCVYFGSNLFNARASATNFNDEELQKAIEYAKIRNVKTNLVLNILIKNNEFEDAILLAQKAYNYGVDAIIVQDLGLAKKLIELFPDLPIHASTQMTIHNLEGALQAEQLGFKRAVLSRELNIDEIKYICDNTNIEIEVFVHGALCISYSGQCLLSSMIGARSGNRGKCAQPCRLPYKLIEKSSDKEQQLDNGYLLSTKDLNSLELLPTLVNLGIKCFKIEGRLKTPEYVGTVTRIYRKYIDLAMQKNVPYIIDEKDKQDLLQVFNRGGASCGYLKPEPNTSLIYKHKPNNMGIYLGTVNNFNNNKGYVTVKLETNIEIGDTVSVASETGTYTISELLINNKNTPTATKGDIVKLGRIKGNISNGDKIYKISSKKLNNSISESINNENIKQDINCKITVHKNAPISMRIYTEASKNPLLNNIDFTINSDLIPVDAINAPTTKERIFEQINKISNTPFQFKNIEIDLDDNLFIPGISKLNQLRRDAIEKLNEIILNKLHRSSNIPQISNTTDISESQVQNNNKVSILLHTLNTNYDYSKLTNIDRLYIPLKYWYMPEFENVLKTLTHNYKTYIYMPSILKKNDDIYVQNTLQNIVNTYSIAGFVLSNISHFNILKPYKNYDFIANYTLNIYNDFTINELANLGVSTVTLSPELDKTSLNSFKSHVNTEAIVYGNLPVMTTNYCLLSKSGSCLQVCKNNCSNPNKKYYLKDRINLDFRIIPDSFSKTTTIFNSKKLSISASNVSTNYIRLDFLDENIDEINVVIEKFKNNEILEGIEYTNGNFNRIV